MRPWHRTTDHTEGKGPCGGGGDSFNEAVAQNHGSPTISTVCPCSFLSFNEAVAQNHGSP